MRKNFVRLLCGTFVAATIYVGSQTLVPCEELSESTMYESVDEMEAGIKLGLLKSLKLPATVTDLNESGFYELDGVCSHDELAISEIVWHDGLAFTIKFTDPFVLQVLNVPGVTETTNAELLSTIHAVDVVNNTVSFNYGGISYVFTFNENGAFASLEASVVK